MNGNETTASGLCLWMILAVAMDLSGCAVTPSSNVATSGMDVSYSISSDTANGVNATAQFTVSGDPLNYIVLSSGDTLTVNGSPMNESDVLGDISYVASLPYEAEGTYTFVYTRSGESPYTATVTLPSPIEITSPTSGARVPSGESISATWDKDSNSSDSVSVSFSNGSSGAGFSQEFEPDSGEATIPASYVTVAPPGPAGSGQLTLTCGRQGTMPSGLSGSISASVQSTIDLAIQ